MEITTNFPTSNILVERIEGDEAWVRQDLRHSTEWWFYWHFGVRGAAGRTVTFHFTDKWSVFGVRGPAVSLDRGRTWDWMGRDQVTEKTFTYTFAPDAGEVRFSFCIPYAQADLHAFLRDRPGIECDSLCLSPKGRRVERVRIGRRDAPRRVLLTCRSHACESAASFVLEGILDRWHDGAPDDASLTAVPFIDKDGVELGDQGKLRNGHDHNRDYIPLSRYPETTAVMAMVRDWPAPPAISFDLHCPHIRGKWNERAYIVGSPDPDMAQRQQRFLNSLVKNNPSPIPVQDDDLLPFGEAWHTKRPAPGANSASNWMTQQGAGLAMTMEVPYAQVRGVDSTPSNLRDFGRALGDALRQWQS